MRRMPLKKLPKNRALQYKESIEQGKGVRLYDVDLMMVEHMIDTVLATVEIFQEKQKVSVVYGNWKMEIGTKRWISKR